MKVSVNWIRYYNEQYKSSADIMPNGIDDLVEKIGAQLGAVEEVIDLGKRYEKILVVKIVSCEKHPNADKLSLCFVDDGGVAQNVERNENGHAQVVCGAPNVKAGLTVAWIPPGATVPSTHDKDPFVLEARELRGKISNGMLASPKELALGDSHEGILEIEEDVKPGTPFAEVYKLNDHIIDIENKMFTHRPDLFGQIGIARELAGIYGHSYKSPNWYKIDAEVPSSNAQDTCKLEVKNEVRDLVPRFCLLVIKDVKVGPSPVWLQSWLSRIGVKSINNIVDLTNYFTHLTAQPSHAYDYDKVKAQDEGADSAMLIVRKPYQDEKLTLSGGKEIDHSRMAQKVKLLNGKEITPNNDDILIATRDKIIGLAGVMGGADTEVDENTKNIILEVGTWDMNTIRRTSMAHGLFTDAATRFTKGQSPLQNKAVIAKMAEDILHLAGGRVCGGLYDDNHLDPEITQRGSLHPPVETTLGFINERLGLSLNSDEIRKILTNVEFKVEATGEKLKVSSPFWRTDIEIPEDIVEEVGRLYGYDKLPLELPKRYLTPAAINQTMAFKTRLREILAKAGANEVLNYSFVHGNLLEKAGQDKNLAFKLNNAISPDLQYYRLSLTPSLLEKVHPNIKAGFDEFAIYEINKVHNKKLMDHNQPDIPYEFNNLALVFAANTKKAKDYSGAAYYHARKILTYLLNELGLENKVHFVPLDPDRYVDGKEVIVAYEVNRAASLHIGKVNIGAIGEYNSSVRGSLKLPTLCAGFELDVTALQQEAKPYVEYKPLNKFPSLEQDITLRTDAIMQHARLSDFLEGQLEEAAQEHGYNFELVALDIFQKDDDNEQKQTTWRITLFHPERTLTTVETNELLDKIADEAKNQLKAERI
jgi:phenylalanyl-tRNA synthetase beta chain